MSEEGFSLIEALVALAIIGIAAAGLIRAAEAHIDGVRGLELRAAAQWVAENRLAELRLAGPHPLPADQEMLGHRWHLTEGTKLSADPDLRTVEVRVQEVGAAAPLVTMHGFVDAGVSGR